MARCRQITFKARRHGVRVARVATRREHEVVASHEVLGGRHRDRARLSPRFKNASTRPFSRKKKKTKKRVTFHTVPRPRVVCVRQGVGETVGDFVRVVDGQVVAETSDDLAVVALVVGEVALVVGEVVVEEEELQHMADAVAVADGEELSEARADAVRLARPDLALSMTLALSSERAPT